jgi:Domain of unknown function (DUF4276)
MTIHLLVEGPSEQEFLEQWAPRLLKEQQIRIHPHQGKGAIPRPMAYNRASRLRGLLDLLPAKLLGFAESLNHQTDGVLILVDADNDRPLDLAQRISAIAKACAPTLRIGICIAVEEMEAFYLGDLRALQIAYPGADMRAARHYVPDSIVGTWELFGSVIGDGGGNKVAWAEAMGPYVTTKPAESRSPSFRILISELEKLSSIDTPRPKRRRFIHRSKAG